MATMKAVQIKSYGGTEVLNYETTEQPSPGEGEVLVRVRASSVNPFDCAVRAGYVSGWYSYSFPLILGLDISGEVVALGSGVGSVRTGQAVFGRVDPSRLGAYAEYAVVRAEDITPKPQSLDHIHSAAMPHVLLTAWAGLIEGAQLKKGQTVLIHGAAGGVGHMAVQIAKMQGANVIGTASEDHIGFLNQIGVDEAINYNKTAFEKVAHNVDVVLDNIGGETQQRSWGVLKRGGILLSPAQMPSEEMAVAHGVRQQFVSSIQIPNGILKEYAARVDDGKLKPEVSEVVPLSEIRRAHQLSEGRHLRGKLVLQVED